MKILEPGDYIELLKTRLHNDFITFQMIFRHPFDEVFSKYKRRRIFLGRYNRENFRYLSITTKLEDDRDIYIHLRAQKHFLDFVFNGLENR